MPMHPLQNHVGFRPGNRDDCPNKGGPLTFFIQMTFVNDIQVYNNFYSKLREFKLTHKQPCIFNNVLQEFKGKK